MSMYESRVACGGCGGEELESALKLAWVRTPLGNATVRAHKGCEWDAIRAMERAAGGEVKVIDAPLTQAERHERRERDGSGRER